MAGRPKWQNALRIINERGGPDYVLAHVADGGTIAELAAELGCTRQQLSTYINSDPEAAGKLDAARREAAEAHADETLAIADGLAEERFSLQDILDTIEAGFNELSDDTELLIAVKDYVRQKLAIRHVSSEEVQAAKVRIDTRRWLAALNHPDRFAEKNKQPQINVNIGSLHLDALRRRSVDDPAAPVIPDMNLRMRTIGGN